MGDRPLGLVGHKFEGLSVAQWESGEKQPTLRQLEAFAKRTMTPFGYLFLPSPPDERLPIPDFRTVGDKPIGRPSPNLIDTIQAMQRRQAWMRDLSVEQGQAPLPFVGSVSSLGNVDAVVAQIRRTLRLSDDWAAGHSTWEDACGRCAEVQKTPESSWRPAALSG